MSKRALQISVRYYSTIESPDCIVVFFDCYYLPQSTVASVYAILYVVYACSAEFPFGQAVYLAIYGTLL